MRNLEIAYIFNQIADLLEIQSANPFRIRAYRRAASSLENLTDTIEVLIRQGTIREIPGIGDDLAKKIIEFVDTGKMVFFEDLKKEVPSGLVLGQKLVAVGRHGERVEGDENGPRLLGFPRADKHVREADDHVCGLVVPTLDRARKGVIRAVRKVVAVDCK